jgi:hypothetical protein
MAVDIALVTQVLPDPANPAKDLGIMNLPSTLVPTVAPVVLAIGATAASPQNSAALFVVGAACILPIRGVR